jgi:hypothetical protein
MGRARALTDGRANDQLLCVTSTSLSELEKAWPQHAAGWTFTNRGERS